MAPVVMICEPGRTPLRLQLGPDPIEVGRDCSGLLLSDSQVSRRHLELRREGSSVVVVDLGSTNGTRLDDVPFTGSRMLGAGQIVRLGSTTITLVEPRRAAADDRVGRSTSIDLLSATILSMPGELPSLAAADQQTLTIVFSDIEDSTRRAVELGDERWMALLQVHNAMVRKAVGRHGGREIKTLGDGFMLTFPSARSALLTMIEVQRAVRAYSQSNPTDAMSVRVGVHTGEAMPDAAGDLIGHHVILASRIANAAKGGEILASPIVFEITASRGDMAFGEPRTVELKGIDRPIDVRSVAWK